MSIARIENGAVVELRHFSLPDVPEHKRASWRPVEGEPPIYNSALSVLSGPELVVEPSRVLRQWTVTPRSATEQKVAVKQEAQRRIMALTGAPDINGCIIKQINALMRGTELTNKVAAGGALTEAEQAEAVALQTFADKIKAIRAASDVVEAIEPIPTDYAADSRWPA